MNSESKHTLDEQSLEAARRCFREAVAWGCEPEDALPSAITAYLDLLAARAEGKASGEQP